MKQHTFESYEDYINTQQTLTRRKVRWGNKNHTILRKTVLRIYDHHYKVGKVSRGVCHGVRYGDELDMFEQVFDSGEWIGTEIFQDLCDGKRILCQDFSFVPVGWVGSFDLIYSNALDHSLDPVATIKSWLSCLSNDGRLYIEWVTSGSDRLGKFTSRADCFAADKVEYHKLLSDQAFVEDVLDIKVKRRRNDRAVFVVAREPSSQG